MRILCVASGESLTKKDLDYCRGKITTYVVNDVYKLAPWAGCLYAADTQWWDYHNGVGDFKGRRVTVSHDASLKYGLEYMKYDTRLKWSDKKGVLATGGNSGFQCMNFAELSGATEIILLGYDMGFKSNKHFFGEHHASINRSSNYADWLERLNEAAPYIKARVINCSRESAIKCFERAKLEDVL